MTSIPNPLETNQFNADMLLESVENDRPINFGVDGKVQAVASGLFSIYIRARSLIGRCSFESRTCSEGALKELAKREDVSDRNLLKIINKLVANCLIPDVESAWIVVSNIRVIGASTQVTKIIGMKMPEVQDFALARSVVSCELFHSHATSLTDKENLKPIAAESGSSGVYFIKDPVTFQSTGVFKPSDEEAFCDHNPKHMTVPKRVTRSDILWNIRSGYSLEGDCKREVGSHAIAEALGYRFTPSIKEVNLPFKESAESNNIVIKSGSLQVFVEGTALVDDPKLLETVPPMICKEPLYLIS